MRLIGAGLFVFAGFFAAVAALDAVSVLDNLPAWIFGVVSGVALFVLIGAAMWLFSPRGPEPVDRESHVRELERQGLLESTQYQAVRAFAVDECEDEGLSYFLELPDRRVLFLSGQYLYDYEPDPKENRVRRFPCSEFSIRRHKRGGYVVDLQCRGSLLEPEAIARPFRDEDWKSGRVPEDGEILPTMTYDDAKREQLHR